LFNRYDECWNLKSGVYNPRQYVLKSYEYDKKTGKWKLTDEHGQK